MPGTEVDDRAGADEPLQGEIDDPLSRHRFLVSDRPTEAERLEERLDRLS